MNGNIIRYHFFAHYAVKNEYVKKILEGSIIFHTESEPHESAENIFVSALEYAQELAKQRHMEHTGMSAINGEFNYSCESLTVLEKEVICKQLN